MNPSTPSRAWGPQHVFLDDPDHDNADRRTLDHWAADPAQALDERRPVAVTRILRSHSEHLDLSDLGLTTFPPFPPHPGWRHVDLSNNWLQEWPADAPAGLRALGHGTVINLEGNLLVRPPPWVDTLKAGLVGLPDASTLQPGPGGHLYASSGTWGGTVPSSMKAPAEAPLTHACRLALHLGNRMSLDQVIDEVGGNASMRSDLAEWVTRRRPYLRQLLLKTPHLPFETQQSHVERLLAADPTLNTSDLRALTRCHPSRIHQIRMARLAAPQ